ILSAKATVDDRVKGLQAGGDDYLVKPFAFSELLARVQALIRRATHAAEPTRLTVGELTLDLLNREVTRNGRSIELQTREVSHLQPAVGPVVRLHLHPERQRALCAGLSSAGFGGPAQRP